MLVNNINFFIMEFVFLKIRNEIFWIINYWYKFEFFKGIYDGIKIRE